MKSNNYISIPIENFKRTPKEIPIDVFIKLNEDNYAHIFSKATGVDYVRLNQYVKKGVELLYVRESDSVALEQYLARTCEVVFADPNVSDSKKVAVLLNMVEQNLTDLFGSIKVSPDVASASQKVVKNFISVLSTDPKMLTTLMKIASHGDYLFYHSVSTSVVSMILAKGTQKADSNLIEICGLGGFLHDIGLTRLPKDIIEAQDDLTAADWREVRIHPSLGTEMIQLAKSIPDEVRYIIEQHHEEPRGKGYPKQLRGNVIFYPAKIVAVADSFCALISKRPFRDAFSPEQAINVLKHEIGKYDRDLVLTLETIITKIPSKSGAIKKAA